MKIGEIKPHSKSIDFLPRKRTVEDGDLKWDWRVFLGAKIFQVSNSIAASLIKNLYWMNEWTEINASD